MNTNEKIEELNEIMALIKESQKKENSVAKSSVDNVLVMEHSKKETWEIFNTLWRMAGCVLISSITYYILKKIDMLSAMFEYDPFWYLVFPLLMFICCSQKKSKESKNQKNKELFEMYTVDQESIKLLMKYNLKFNELNNEIKLIMNDGKPVDILEDFKSTLQSYLSKNNGKLQISRFNLYVKLIMNRHERLSGYHIMEKSKEIVETLESEIRQNSKSIQNTLNKERIAYANEIVETPESEHWHENKPFEIHSNKELSMSVKYLNKEERLAHANKIVEQPISGSRNNQNTIVQICLAKQKECIHEK